MKGRTNEKNLDVITIVLLFLIFMIVLITLTGSIYYFYRGSATLLAGIIAFVGAIIGGMITLLGVNRTIAYNKLQSKIDKIPMKLRKVVSIKLKLQELRNMYKIVNQSINVPRDQANSIAMEFIQKHELVIVSAELSTELYKGTYNLYNTLISSWNTYSKKMNALNGFSNSYFKSQEFFIYRRYCEECIQEVTNLITMYEKVEKDLQKELEIDDSYKTE